MGLGDVVVLEPVLADEVAILHSPPASCPRHEPNHGFQRRPRSCGEASECDIRLAAMTQCIGVVQILNIMERFRYTVRVERTSVLECVLKEP